jgi:hypothetical protein
MLPFQVLWILRLGIRCVSLLIYVEKRQHMYNIFKTNRGTLQGNYDWGAAEY